MDIIAIQDTIELLENEDTTIDNVERLADLYVVRDHLNSGINLMSHKEFNDILPSYYQYCDTKRRYQMSEVSEGAVVKDLKKVCTEIQEFIHTIYTGTDMRRERKILEDCLGNLNKCYCDNS